MRFLYLPFALFLSFNAYAADKDTRSYGLTIYSKATPGSISPSQFRPTPDGGYGYSNSSSIPGYAVIRQKQDITLNEGITPITLTDVAAFIDPTTVIFKSLSHPNDTHVIEQNYLFDLVSQEALLGRYLGKEVIVENNVGDTLQRYEGVLMSTLGGLVLQNKDGQVTTLSRHDSIRLPELPDGLKVKPTLAWEVETSKPGTHGIEVSYQTDGITWWADYNMVFAEKNDANTGTLDVNAWVSIVNQSGASYPGAKLKLMAGDVQRIAPPTAYMDRSMASGVVMEMAKAPGFEEKAFFEYHLYTLGRPASLPDNSTKQLELFPAVAEVPVKKEFIYNGQRENKVNVILTFKNSKENHMGMPLPAGRVRISKRDTDGSLEFVGEDVIKHTPKDEDIRLKLGSAFDVTGERKQTQYHVDTTRKQADETIEITLRNHKDAPISLIVEENLQRYAEWEIARTTDKWEKEDAGTIRFPITLEKDEEKTVQYTAKYRW